MTANGRLGLRWSTLTCLGVTVVALAAACGGGGSGEPTASPTASNASPTTTPVDEEARALLQQMVLRAEDLPAGMQRASASVSSNEDVAGLSEAQLDKLRQWGRRLGYDVQLEPEQGDVPDLPIKGVQSTASLYTTAQGAGESFAEGIAASRQTDWASLYKDVKELKVEEVPRSGLGDEAVWFRISGVGSLEELVLDDQVAFRVGPVRGFLRVATVFPAGTARDVYMDEVEGWVRTVTKRIEEVLAGGGAPSASP